MSPKQKLHRQHRIAAGLCAKCGNKREAISPVTCEQCRADLRVKAKAQHPWRKTFKREWEL
jgi:hypothetical protein